MHIHLIFIEFRFKLWHKFSFSCRNNWCGECMQLYNSSTTCFLWKKKKGSQFYFLVYSVVFWSLGSCKSDVYFIKMTMARHQIGSMSGNWDEMEPCRGTYNQQGILRGRKGTESRNAQLDSWGAGGFSAGGHRSWSHRSKSLCSQTPVVLQGFFKWRNNRKLLQ